MNSPFERLPAEIFASSEEGARWVAQEIADLIRSRGYEGMPAVLGLATGSTPVPVYRELVRLHREEGLSFKNVIAFNLDEYYPLARSHRESYWRFMQEQLFAHVDINPDDIHVPDGEVSRESVAGYCRDYEAAIRDAGGIDLQILGIGRTGHIGFNEPGSGGKSLTRLVTLDAMTRRDAARDFLGEDKVPRYAITMGVGTILKARRILLLAWGRNKADVVAGALEREPTEQLPASYLQQHANTVFVLDRPAASTLTRVTQPWLVDFVDWTPEMVRRAVVNLCQKVGKPILKLVDKDYNENGLADLLTVKGAAYQLNIDIFNVLQHTITGWPGGKPNADDSKRPERAEPASKRVLILTAEPQEDILGMGATVHRLVEQGHEVTIAYATSGDLAVPDSEALAALELARGLDELVCGAGGVRPDYADRMNELCGKSGFETDDKPAIREIKGVLREGEARQAMRVLGVGEERLRFLRLPFYSKGRYRQFVMSEEDVDKVRALLEAISPQQVFLSGSEDDPSSVAGLTYRIFRQAFAACRAEHEWPQDTRVWIYRGSASEWPVERIDMAVPLSPGELHRKIMAAFQHRSQHSQTPLALIQQSEYWQRTEQINRRTARTYDALGMAEYEAIECFVRAEETPA